MNYWKKARNKAQNVYCLVTMHCKHVIFQNYRLLAPLIIVN